MKPFRLRQLGFLIGIALGFSLPAFGILKEADRQKIEVSRNLLPNPGIENGAAGYSVTGGSLAVETATPLEGNASLTWDPSATGQFLRSDAITIPEGLKGQRCAAEVKLKWTSGTSGQIKLGAYDGSNTLVEKDLDPTTASVPVQPDLVVFTCPTSGTVQFQLESTADAAAITVDSLRLGEPSKQNLVASAELVTQAYYPDTTGCDPDVTSTSFASLVDDPECPGITVVSSTIPVNTSDINNVKLVYDYLPPGRYWVEAKHTLSVNSQVNSAARITDGTTNGPGVGVRNSSATTSPFHLVVASGVFEYTSGGARTFELQGQASGGAYEAIVSGTEQRNFVWTVMKFPLGSEKALSFAQADWHIDANIGGANITLGTGAQTAYVEMTNAGLDLVTNPGSAPVQIACASGTASTGSTCSSNESNGTAFVIPRAGKYEACVSFSLNNQTASYSSQAFEIIETTNTSSAIVQEGNVRSAQGSSSGENEEFPNRLCGYFKFDSAGQKTLRLMYEKSVTTADPQILADRAAGFGQRDVHWFVRPLVYNQTGIHFDDMVSTEAQSGAKVVGVYVDYQGTGIPIIADQTGNAASGIVDVNTGEFEITWNAGVWANQPICTCAVFQSETRVCPIEDSNFDISKARFRIFNTSTGSQVDPPNAGEGAHVFCIGQN